MGRTSGGPLELVAVQAVANPAAGADWTTSPAAAGELVAVTATFVSSATAANRLPVLQVVDGAGHILVYVPSSTVQAASLTETYMWQVGGPFASGNNMNFSPLPSGLVVPTTYTVKTVTGAIQVTDQWSNVVLTFVSR